MTSAETLRRVALHEETAALLRQRASRAATSAAAESLRRRADEHARRAAELRGRCAPTGSVVRVRVPGPSSDRPGTGRRC